MSAASQQPGQVSGDKNWAGNYEFLARSIVAPGSVEAVRAEVRKPGRVRALGTRHSFNDLADTSGTLISVVDLPADPVLDESARTVTVGAGTPYGVLAGWLDARGWALHNLGSLPHISIAGAVSTGTHGSGDRNGVLSTAVRAIEFVDHRGDLVTLDRDDPRFVGLVVGLGAFGIIVRVTLDVQPAFRVRQDVFEGVSWDAFLSEPATVTGAAYSVSVFTHWLKPELDQVWLKTRLVSDEDVVPDRLLDGHRVVGDDHGISDVIGENATLRGGVPGPWNERLPHFRLDAVPSVGAELQSEYFVDRKYAASALNAVRSIAPLFSRYLVITELRTAAADDLWLSGAFQRDTLGIHFTWKLDMQGVLSALPAIEEVLEPFDARPHWGKVHLFSAETLHRVHPRLDAAARLFAELDPEGRFANDHLLRLGVRS